MVRQILPCPNACPERQASSSGTSKWASRSSKARFDLCSARPLMNARIHDVVHPFPETQVGAVGVEQVRRSARRHGEAHGSDGVPVGGRSGPPVVRGGCAGPTWPAFLAPAGGQRSPPPSSPASRPPPSAPQWERPSAIKVPTLDSPPSRPRWCPCWRREGGQTGPPTPALRPGAPRRATGMTGGGAPPRRE